MSFQIAKDEYEQALRRGHKEYKELVAAGRPPHPAVLDDILEEHPSDTVQDIGLVEVPAQRVIGTKSAGRITAFTATFRPLLGPESEFALKWANLCAAHLSDVGIREPIACFEYLGNFYVQEGNKRVSVLRHFGAARIPGYVKRIVPPLTDEPRIRAYYEFMEFFKSSQLYTVQFRRPGDYDKLLAFLGKEAGEEWEEQERRTFNAYFQYFREAFNSLNVKLKDILPEEALLLWLKVHPYRDLGRLTGAQLKKTLAALWSDVVASSPQSEVTVQTKPVVEAKTNLLTRIITAPEHLNVAFVHQLKPSTSAWVLGHEDGRKHIEAVFGDKITVRSYYDANTAEATERLLEQAVAEGANVVFTTAPRLSRETLKIAVKYPKVHFLNCSVDQPYSSVRTYYGRMYEAKFITGAIAGAMAQKNRIGYIAAYPIFGEIASINAFALGALLTNPRAEVELRWSCVEGTPQADLLGDGVRVISNREVPTQDKMYLDFCSYGTYLADDLGNLIPLGSPVWVWGKFYEFVIRRLLDGTWKEDKSNPRAVNYWLGMDSDVISIRLADRLPVGVTYLAKLLRRELTAGNLDPFARKILAQDGTVKNDGSKTFTPEELLKMDWLCANVVGDIPEFQELLPIAQPVVRELGIYRDKIPALKETDV
ncbi:MAG: BMP family ABC transporter substrate-binding protein [Oscillospiraceae bacterium]|nr:BMP family ABC transporter substrate-binding protein [Oscillospiraceae bacterium]